MSKINHFLHKKPFISFIIILTFLLALILLSNFIRKPEVDNSSHQENIPTVSLYNLGSTQLTTTAKINNQGVIEIIAQSSGVVQSINVKEGQKLGRGHQLLSLATNYQGGNISALQLELAEKKWLLDHANFWDQKSIDDLGDNLKKVTTEQNLGLSNGPAVTYNLQQQQKMSNLSLDMKERGQQVSLDSTQINLELAQISASLMRPASPVAGVVEEIKVRLGQVVNPGQVVAVIRAQQNQVTLDLSLSESTIRRLDISQTAWFDFADASYSATLDYLPTTPTQGSSYSLSYAAPAAIAAQLPHGNYLPMHLPLSSSISSSSEILVPLSAIYQTQSASFTYTLAYNEAGESIARQKELVLGPVIGDLVTIKSGLDFGDQIILANNLFDNQKVRLSN